MTDHELWSAIIGILAAIVVRVLDHYFPGIGRVTEATTTTDNRPSTNKAEGRHVADDQDTGRGDRGRDRNDSG